MSCGLSFRPYLLRMASPPHPSFSAFLAWKPRTSRFRSITRRLQSLTDASMQSSRFLAAYLIILASLSVTFATYRPILGFHLHLYFSFQTPYRSPRKPFSSLFPCCLPLLFSTMHAGNCNRLRPGRGDTSTCLRLLPACQQILSQDYVGVWLISM
jgi:hypothetical protein